MRKLTFVRIREALRIPLGLLWHLVVAGIIGPYLVTLSYLQQNGHDLAQQGLLLTLLAPLAVHIFVFYITVPFALLTLLPLAFIAEIEKQAHRNAVFCGAGLVIGLAVGLWMITSHGTATGRALLFLTSVCTGFLCGFIDSLPWREATPDPSLDALDHWRSG